MSHVLKETCLDEATLTVNEYQRKGDTHSFLSDSVGPEGIVDRRTKVEFASTFGGICSTFRVA